MAATPPFTLPNLSDGRKRTLRIAVDKENKKVQAELVIPGPQEEVLPLWEVKLPDRGLISSAGTRLLGLTAATGGISQAVSAILVPEYPHGILTPLDPLYSMRSVALMSGTCLGKPRPTPNKFGLYI